MQNTKSVISLLVKYTRAIDRITAAEHSSFYTFFSNIVPLVVGKGELFGGRTNEQILLKLRSSAT